MLRKYKLACIASIIWIINVIIKVFASDRISTDVFVPSLWLPVFQDTSSACVSLIFFNNNLDMSIVFSLFTVSLMIVFGYIAFNSCLAYILHNPFKDGSILKIIVVIASFLLTLSTSNLIISALLFIFIPLSGAPIVSLDQYTWYLVIIGITSFLDIIWVILSLIVAASDNSVAPLDGEGVQKWSKVYPFIAGINLEALVTYSIKTGFHQYIVIHDTATGEWSRIACSHVKLADVTGDQFTEAMSKSQKFLSLLTSKFHKPREIDISIEDRVFALNSWVEGIAEAGFSAFSIAEEDAKHTRLMPVITPILLFVSLRYPALLDKYIEELVNMCIFEGTIHVPSFVMNAIKIFTIARHYPGSSTYQSILKKLMHHNPPFELFEEETDALMFDEAAAHPAFKTAFTHSNRVIRCRAIYNSVSASFPEFPSLVQSAIANRDQYMIGGFLQNKDAPRKHPVLYNQTIVSIFNRQLTFNKWHRLDLEFVQYIADNVNAPFCDAYRMVFSLHNNIGILKSVAANINAPRLKEFRMLYHICDSEIAYNLLKNTSAVSAYPRESELLTDYVGKGDVGLNQVLPFPIMTKRQTVFMDILFGRLKADRIAAIANPNAPYLPNFDLLAEKQSEDPHIRQLVRERAFYRDHHPEIKPMTFKS